MKVDEKGHTIVIKDTQGNSEAFLMKVTHEYKTFENHNMILDVSHDSDIDAKKLSMFNPLSKQHRKARKSFVIVATDIDYNLVPAALHVVPSLQEAHDIVEMEEIERDLGF